MPPFGFTDDAPDPEIFLDFGVDVGPGGAHGGGLYVPTTSRSR